LLNRYFKQTSEELTGRAATRYEFIRLVLAKYNRDENYIAEVFEVLHVLWAQIALEYRGELNECTQLLHSGSTTTPISD
jgi:hypothetical protein